MSDTMELAQGLGELMYQLHNKNGGRNGVGDLVIEWAKDHFYGLRMEDRIVDFKELWKKLTDNGKVSYESGLVTGDLDITLWAETIEDGSKVIISVNHCTCADDNTTIYKMKEFEYSEEDTTNEEVLERLKKSLFEFHVFTCYPYATRRNATGYQWGDHRDIENPSLNTIREYNFDFGYGDGRDKTHVAKMKYHHSGKPMVDKASWNESRISIEIEELARQNGMFEYELENQ